MADYTLSYESSLDASDFLGSIRDMISGLDDVRGAADDTRSAFDQLGDINLGSAISSLDGLGSAAKDVGGAAQEAKSSFDLLDAIELGAVMVAVQGLIGLMEDLTGTIEDSVRGFAELEDAATRASMMGGGGNAAQYMAQSTQLGLKYGVSPATISPMLGMSSAYGSTMSQNMNPDLVMAISRITGMNPNDAAAALGGAMSATSITGTQYSDKALSDMLTKSFMMTGGKMTPGDFGQTLAKLMPMAGQFGGIPGTLGMMDVTSMIGLPGGSRGGLLQVANFTSQLDQIYEEVDKKGNVKLKGSQKIIDEFTSQGLDPLKEKSKGAIQAIIDLYNVGGVQAFEKLGVQGGVLAQIAGHYKEWQKATEMVSDSTGETDRDIEKLSNDTETSLGRIKVGFTAMSDTMGSVFSGPIKGIADFVTGPLLTSFDEFFSKIKSGDIRGAFQGISNDIIKSLSSIDFTALGTTIREKIYAAFSSIDYTTLGRSLGVTLNSAMNLAWGMVKGVDVLGSLNKIGEGLMAALGPSLELVGIKVYGVFIDIEQYLLDTVKFFAKSAPDLAIPIVKAALDIEVAFGKAWNTILLGSSIAFEGIKGVVTGVASGVQNFAAGAAGNLNKPTGTGVKIDPLTGQLHAYINSKDMGRVDNEAQGNDFINSQTGGGGGGTYISTAPAMSKDQASKTSSINFGPIPNITGGTTVRDLTGSGTTSSNSVSPIPMGWMTPGHISKVELLIPGGGSLADYLKTGKEYTGGLTAFTQPPGMGPQAFTYLTQGTVFSQSAWDRVENWMIDNTTNTQAMAESIIQGSITKPLQDRLDASQQNINDQRREQQGDMQKWLEQNTKVVDNTKDTSEGIKKINSMMPNTGGATTGAGGLTPMQQIALGGIRTPGMFYGEGVHGPQINGFLTPEGGYVGPTEYYPQYRNQINMGIEASQVALAGITPVGGFGLAGKAGTGAVGATSTNLKVGIDLSEAKTTLTTYIDQIKQMHPEMHVKITPDVDAGALVQLVQQAVARELARRGL